MSKLRQVLHLFCQGQSKLKIAELTGVSRNTVKRYLRDFISLRTTWEEISRLNDKDLDELFNGKEPPENTNERIKELHAYFAQNDKRLRKRGVTLVTLFIDYYTGAPGRFSRTRFYHYYHLWKKKVEPSMRIEHKAGDKVFVDFAGEKLVYADEQTGEIKEAEVFVAILGASQYTYVEAVESQKAEDLITACENALHFFGGSPLAIVSDNLKSAVIKSNRYEPNLNENFEAFADHYAMAVIPARAYKPKDKSLVEGAVRIMYQRIYAHLPQGEHYTLRQLNERIIELLTEHNKKRFTGRNYSREEQFIEMEKEVLQELPQKRFEIRRSVVVTVMKNGHVCLSADKHYYSVPYGHIGKKVKVLFSKSTVEIFFKYELIACHTRIRSPHNYTTDPTHMATQHQKMLEWSPEYFLQQAREIHADVENYIHQVLKKKQHPEQAYKSCQGILSFAKRLGRERLIKACQHANACDIYNFRIIETILKNGMDMYETTEDEPTVMPTHENIRGEEYYS